MDTGDMDTSDMGTILIIEDDASFRRTYQDMFNAAGYGVIIADNGEIGWDLAKSKKPDMIMLDLYLPGLHGFEVLKYIRSDSETKEIPVIITTSMSEKENIKKGLELGATDYMVKGFFTPREVLAKIRSVFVQAKERKGFASYKVSLNEAKRDAMKLVVDLGFRNSLVCPDCQEELYLNLITDSTRTDSHWYLAHFMCPKCQKSF